MLGNAMAMRGFSRAFFGAGLLIAAGWAVCAVPLPAKAETEVEQVKAILGKADEAYGEYLAGQCVTCHHAEGKAKGIPAINGLPDVYIVELMLDYKFAREERTNPAMVNIAKNLSDEELGSLAKHFSKQKPE